MARTDGGQIEDDEQLPVTRGDLRVAMANANSDRDAAAADKQQQLEEAQTALAEERRQREEVAKSVAERETETTAVQQQLQTTLRAEQATTEAHSREITYLKEVIEQMQASQQRALKGKDQEVNITETVEAIADKIISAVARTSTVIDLTEEKKQVLTKDEVLKILQEHSLEKQYSMHYTRIAY